MQNLNDFFTARPTDQVYGKHFVRINDVTDGVCTYCLVWPEMRDSSEWMRVRTRRIHDVTIIEEFQRADPSIGQDVDTWEEIEAFEIHACVRKALGIPEPTEE